MKLVRSAATDASVHAILNTAPADDVLRSLHAVRRRMLVQSFIATLGRLALLLGGALVVVGVVRRWVWNVSPWHTPLALGGAGTVFVVALLVALARRPTLPRTAAAIDRLGATRDRFVTALDFSDAANSPTLHALAVQECTRFIRGGDFVRLIRLRWPRELAYLLVPAIALALLYWEARGTLGARADEHAAAQAEVEGTAKTLEELAKQMEKANEEDQTEQLQKLAEELKRSAQQLRAEASTSEEAEKAALRELSELEKLVRELQQQPGTPSPTELRELAKALEKQEQTKEAAAALNAGDLAKAAEQLEKAMQDLTEAGDEATKEQIEQALKEAMERLAEQKQLSEALEKLAKQMQQAGGQDGKGGESMSKELADLLKKMQPQAGKGQQAGKPLSEQSLKNLLAALQNLKFGEGQPNPGDSKPGDQPGGIAMQNFGKNPSPGEGGDPRLPAGSPGSERDTGTTETPFGKDQNAAGEDGQQQSISGRLGQGETLQQFLPGVADASKSKRRYKELYEALAPAAEDAVVQENIPLGSRFFIKRYFESIRPRE